MPEHLRALIVILALSMTVFFVATRPKVGLPVATNDLVRRSALWVGVTVIAFLSHNFWLYVAATTLLLALTVSHERNPLALFMLLLFAVPMFSVEIAGFAGIKQLFALTHPRLLTLILLLPAALALRRSGQAEPLGSLLVDKLLLVYLVYQFGLELTANTLTNTIRNSVFYVWTDVVLPYYVASRALRTLPQFRDAMTMFVLAMMVMGAIAGFEFVKSWWLYSAVSRELGASTGNYLTRGDGGPLRALAAAGHPIVLGYLATIACIFFVYLRRQVRDRIMWGMGMGVLLLGLIAPLSRGPWMGAVIAASVIVALGPKAFGKITRLLLAGLVIVAILMVTPYADSVLNLIPWLGKTESFNVTYRERLIAVSIEVIKLNPFLGSFHFMKNPLMETMRQGEGIIDIVNTYLGVALVHGLIGLGLFISILLVTLTRVVVSTRALPTKQTETHFLGRILSGTLVGIILTIGTVSPVFTAPIVMWLVIGLAVGYTEMVSGISRKSNISESKHHLRAHLQELIIRPSKERS